MEITTMETLAARMAVQAEETSKLVKSAGKWLGVANKVPARVVEELRKRGMTITEQADTLAKETEGLGGAMAVCAEKFVAGVRAVAGAVLMSATGVATRDVTMLRLAKLAQHEGTTVMTAAWLTTQNWD